MNQIPVTKIFNITDPTEFKFHAGRWNGESNPLDVYAQDPKEWFGWNTWGDTRNIFNRKYIFSLIDFYPETDMWLFGGVYKVIDNYMDSNSKDWYRYKISEVAEFADYVGRLKVKLPKPSRGKSFLLEKYLGDMMVAEMLKKPYSGEVFPGYENINHEFNALIPIFKNENADWKAALENMQGVYVVTDKSNGKKYVGSAYGDWGIWARWSCYIGTGHGWNSKLTDLIEEKGYEYAQNNFKFSLLEYRSMRVEDHVIIGRENYWKEVFLSRGEFGYNEN